MPYFDINFLYWVLNPNMLRRRIILCFLCKIKWSPGKWLFSFLSLVLSFGYPHIHMHTLSLLSTPLTAISTVLSHFLWPCGQLSFSMELLVWSRSLAQFTLLLEAMWPQCHMLTQHWQSSLVVSLPKNNQRCNWIPRNIKNEILLKSHGL